ncbi:MAG: hypothetical protein ACT4OJ_01335 [Bacteroidota bacterium]
MKRSIYLFILLIALPLFSMAQWPSNVTVVESKSNDSAVVAGDLSTGALMNDLSWASSSANACFVATQNTKFRGNHVLYASTMPPKSVMTISVMPSGNEANLSMYGYMIGSTEFRVVPNLPSCVTCEADYKWDRPVKNKVQTSERTIELRNPTNNSYNIVIGVAGPKDVTTGQYNLMIKLKS